MGFKMIRLETVWGKQQKHVFFLKPQSDEISILGKGCLGMAEK